MTTRWKVEQDEYGALTFMFDGRWEQLNGHTAWSGKDDVNDKTKRYRQAVRECLAQIVHDHNRQEAFEAMREAVRLAQKDLTVVRTQNGKVLDHPTLTAIRNALAMGEDCI